MLGDALTDLYVNVFTVKTLGQWLRSCSTAHSPANESVYILLLSLSCAGRYILNLSFLRCSLSSSTFYFPFSILSVCNTSPHFQPITKLIANCHYLVAFHHILNHSSYTTIRTWRSKQ